MANKQPGRPRSEQSRRSVLEAARDLMADGFHRLTIEGIASRAGVSRQTIYRWWPSKASIVAEAVIDGVIPVGQTPLVTSGDVRADLQSWLRAVAERGSADRDLILALTAAATTSNHTNDELFRRFTSPDRQAVVLRLNAAITTGEVHPAADVEAAADALLGSILIQALQGRPLTVDTADGLLGVVLDGLC